MKKIIDCLYYMKLETVKARWLTAMQEKGGVFSVENLPTDSLFVIFTNIFSHCNLFVLLSPISLSSGQIIFPCRSRLSVIFRSYPWSTTKKENGLKICFGLHKTFVASRFSGTSAMNTRWCNLAGGYAENRLHKTEFHNPRLPVFTWEGTQRP